MKRNIIEEKEIAVELWNAIADDIHREYICEINNILAFKRGYLVAKNIVWENNCFLCHYYSIFSDDPEYKENMCERCPLYKACDNSDCMSRNNLFNLLKNTDDDKEGEKLARSIAELIRELNPSSEELEQMKKTSDRMDGILFR